jgi:4-amino-4-deoxy-L-arabinose transferase-like glycosyltransferase
LSPAAPAPASGTNLSWRHVWLLVAGITLVRLVYLAFLCPYTLVEDEAQYWVWSRFLDWSYYSKGPGIAWSIAAFTGVLGNSELGVRAGAAFWAGLASLLLALLVKRSTGSVRGAFLAAGVFNLIPMFQASSMLMTIDMPYTALWLAAGLCVWEGLARGRGWMLALAGLCVGVGFLFKYTAALVLPGLVLFAILHRKSLPISRASLALGTLAGVVLMALAASPVFVWNAANDWPTFKHTLGHLKLEGGDVKPAQTGYSPLWTLEFLGTQLGLVGPMLILAWLGARRRATHGAERLGRALLFWMGVPILFVYLCVSFRVEPEGNWAFAGYATLAGLAGLAVRDGMADFRAKLAAWRALPEPRPKQGVLTRRPETLAQVAWHATLGVGLVAGVLMLRLDLLAALPVVGAKVPLGRFTGADAMAADAARLRDELRERTGKEPMFIAEHYGRASQLWFYLSRAGEKDVAVFAASPFMGGRRTQWDYWPRTNLLDPALLGRPAVLAGGDEVRWGRAFERVEDRGVLEGDRKRGRRVFLGENYLGFARPAAEAPR